MRNLASIQRIKAIHPIEGRDQIGLAEVLGWHVIVRYDQFKEGDLCVYFEIDSVLPENETFEFMRKHNFRVKTMKMAGQVSQGLCMPLSSFSFSPDSLREGDDVTEIIKVTKYEQADESEQIADNPNGKKKKHPIRSFLYRCRLTTRLAHAIWGNKINKAAFPDFVSKSDEPRIQTIPWMLEKKNIPFEAHEKVDGTSGTFAIVRNNRFFGLIKDYDFIVCSRNHRLPDPDNSSYWSVAERYHIKDVLIHLLNLCSKDAKWICIQGECIGPKVQGNKYNVNEPDIYCFNLIVDGIGKIDSIFAASIVGKYGLKWVPLVDTAYRLPDTVEEVESYVHGHSQIAPVLREGIVFRNYEYNLSWKCVDPLFLLKWKE